MNIKQAATSAITALLVMTSMSAFAQISVSDLNIGGIYYGQPLSDVIRRLGQPEWRKPNFIKFRYQTTNVFITPSEAQTTVAAAEFAAPNPNIKTKAGIGRGSTLADVKPAYGEPDEVSTISVTYLTDVVDGNQYMLNFSIVENDKVFHMFFRKLRKDEHRMPKSKPITPTSTIPDKVTEMPAAELNLGWIAPGQTLAHVEEVYGKPGKIDDQGFFKIYNYNDKFVVKGKLKNGFTVTSVASYQKGNTTPSGFMVGDPYAKVVKKFGAVKGIKFKGEGIEAKLKGCTDYTYFCGDKQMVFLVDKKDIIQAIRVEELDEQKFIEAKRK